MGWHRGHRGYGWGPPRNRRVVIHHGGGGFLGGLVGGVIGGAVVNSMDHDHDRGPPQRVDLPSSIDDIIDRVVQVPEGATVYLKIEEFRALSDRNMISYKDTIPFCMGRRVEVQ